MRRSSSLTYQCLSRCASGVCEPADNHNLHCYCYLRNNDDGCATMMVLTIVVVGFPTCMLRCCSTMSRDRRNRASSRRCMLSVTFFLDHMANDDGNWRTTSTRWNYLEFLTMTRSLRSLERRMMQWRPTSCWVLSGCCYSSLWGWKCLDLSMSLLPTVLEQFQHWAPEYFGNSVVRRHLQKRRSDN